MELAAEVFALLVAVAFLAGTVDAMAGGGGLLTIPAMLAAGLPPVPALATGKLMSTLGTGSAVIAYARAGHVNLRAFAGPVAAAFGGSAAGAITVQHIDPTFLAALVPLLLIAMALYFWLAPPMGDVDRKARLGRVGLSAVCGLIGFYDGFFGPGTGSFLTLALVALGGLGLVRAIANTKLINLATNLSALAAMIAGGHVLWVLGLAMAAANVAGNQLGAFLAIRHGGRGVRPLLVVVSLAMTARLLADPANPLWQLWPG
ncbi:membrane protein [Croceibacterium mercuriale]|uniref:Probable membrane transporter protein n=1 Tax=Croceibacterium mercuriale TaxID=1572751 RepID=A0A0B2BX77_9SPHN|nr:TSUP family transporter [Croceibacterium mercuriale]KHL24602.1 membrane protein [Croceibacterium mercuriale]